MSEQKKVPEIVKGGENFYYCSECKNASNKPEGIPHSPTCSLPDLYKNTAAANAVAKARPA